MGAAVAMYPVSPPGRAPRGPTLSAQGKPLLSAVSKTANRPTKKCHHLAFPCRKCHKPLTIAYPLGVTFWRFDCTCEMNYVIEIIGHRKCLVFEEQGRKTIERIGLTSERSHYYRAKCYQCGTAIMANDQCVDQTQSCHQCGLDYSLSKVQDEVFYQTVIQHANTPVTFRDRVQSLQGYILNKENMFFLDEDGIPGSPQALLETITSLETEVAMLRDRDIAEKTQLMQLHAEKHDLVAKLKKQLAQSVELTQHVQAISQQLKSLETEKQTYTERVQATSKQFKALETEKRLYAERLKELEAEKHTYAERMQRASTQIATLETEKQSYAERLSGYGELVRDLDQKREISSRLELKIDRLNRTIHDLTHDKQRLTSQLAHHANLLQVVEREKEKQLTSHHAEIQQINQLLRSEQKGWQRENRRIQEKMDGYVQRLSELDRQMERADKFEKMYGDAVTKAKKLADENHRLANRLTGHGDLLRDLDRHMEKVAHLDGINRQLSQDLRHLKTQQGGLTEQLEMLQGVQNLLEQERQKILLLDHTHRDTTRKMERLIAENRLLNNTLNENDKQLASLREQLKKAGHGGKHETQWEGKVRLLTQENSLMKNRISELETEVNRLQQKAQGGGGTQPPRGSRHEEPKEAWYADEGDIMGLNPREKGYQERCILGLKGTPTQERIKTALRRRIKKYHPDMVASMGLDLQAVAHKKTQEITHAYAQLMRMYAHT